MSLIIILCTTPVCYSNTKMESSETHPLLQFKSTRSKQNSYCCCCLSEFLKKHRGPTALVLISIVSVALLITVIATVSVPYQGSDLLAQSGPPAQDVQNPIVRTSLGRVEGTKKLSRAGREFFAFYGVPYAKPPVGELRFTVRILKTQFEVNLLPNFTLLSTGPSGS